MHKLYDGYIHLSVNKSSRVDQLHCNYIVTYATKVDEFARKTYLNVKILKQSVAFAVVTGRSVETCDACGMEW